MTVAAPASVAPDRVKITRALISVSDKAGLIDLGRALAARGVELLSTGGTHKALAEAGLKVKEVAAHTGFPEMMDGRVKTLHPTIHGGLLGLRDNPDHAAAMQQYDIAPIDLLVVNLYPFEATVAKGADYATCVENIDIGGPAMIRSAAKNHGHVAVVVEPKDYAALLDELATHDGALTLATRKQLAAKAFSRTAAYDAAISSWFAGQLGQTFPERLSVSGELAEVLRYGENPHQQAAFYRTAEKRPGVATATQVQGKALSFNNLNDTDAAFELVAEFTAGPAVAIIKHANPCGVAVGADLVQAYAKALACDPVSAFGGIIAMNRPLDEAAARAMTDIFTEVIVAPAASDAARAIVATKKNLRLLVTGAMPDPTSAGMTLRSLAGGLLLQTRDNGRIARSDLKVVTKRAPTVAELDDLLFAFTLCKHVKSNTIVYAKNGATVGIGAGQMSRVDAARIAMRKAEDAAAAAGLKEPATRGSVAASDAFFPFADGLETVIEAGATAVIQPGGSLRDNEVIEAADKAGIAMVFTGMRHFRH